MRLFRLAFALAAAASAPATAVGWDRGPTHVFATLPAGASGPEGLEVDAEGNVYVATFGFTSSGSTTGEGQLFVFGENGRFIRQVSIEGSSPHLLGLRFHPRTHALLVIDFGAGQVLDVDPMSGRSSAFMTLPSSLPHAGGAGLNDLTFDSSGNVYVSDSFQGVVWRTGPGGGTAQVWVDSPRLRTTGVPPFGANGLRFDPDETVLYVANTGDDTVIEVPATVGVDGLTAGTPSVFANSVNGADGLLVDEDGNVWLAANQADEIVVLDPTGKAIAKLGDFGGRIAAAGSPVGLLFPASLRFHGRELLVTNLALDLRLFNASYVTDDSEWCAQVSRYTVVSLPLRGREP